MARFRRFSGYRSRARVIIKRVRAYRPKGMSKNSKNMLIIGALALGAYFFKDKISALIKK